MVLGTLQGSQFSKQFRNQVKNIGNWVAEIHKAMYPYLVRTSFCALTVFVDEPSYLMGILHNLTDYLITVKSRRREAARAISTTHRAARYSQRLSTASSS